MLGGQLTAASDVVSDISDGANPVRQKSGSISLLYLRRQKEKKSTRKSSSHALRYNVGQVDRMRRLDSLQKCLRICHAFPEPQKRPERKREFLDVRDGPFSLETVSNERAYRCVSARELLVARGTANPTYCTGFGPW